jgi:hypothetical protein
MDRLERSSFSYGQIIMLLCPIGSVFIDDLF